MKTFKFIFIISTLILLSISCSSDVLEEYPRKYVFLRNQFDMPYFASIQNGAITELDDKGRLQKYYDELVAYEYDNFALPLSQIEIIDDSHFSLTGEITDETDTFNYYIQDNEYFLYAEDEPDTINFFTYYTEDDVLEMPLLAIVTIRNVDYIDRYITTYEVDTYENYISDNIGESFLEGDSLYLNYYKVIYERTE